jgi:aminoglycoside 6-adenylyltransferase
MTASMDHERVLNDVMAWASSEENIRLVVLTGSLAGRVDAVHELSDLDIELYVLDPAPLLERRDWFRRFGDVLVVEELENPAWHPTRLVYYVDGKIDFVVTTTEAARRGVQYPRAYRILLDKDKLSAHLSEVPPRATLPTPEEFDTCANWFYAAALMCAKCITRNEPWMAKFRDWDMKNQLLRMIEWDHKSRYGWSYDTWHRGAHMCEWMDGDIIIALRPCWAGLQAKDMISALWASVELFDRLMRRTASRLGVTAFNSSAVRNEIRRLTGDTRLSPVSTVQSPT